MSRQNVEVVREAFDAYSTGGIEALLPFVHPDVRWYPIPEWLEDPMYRGHEGVRRMVAWADDFDEVGIAIHEIRGSGDRVLVRADMTGRTKASGGAIDQQLSAICSDFREGMIGEWRWFRTWQEALEAVGLTE